MKFYRFLAYLLAAEVVIQAAAIAFALFGLGKWVEDDGGVLNKAVMDADKGPDFTGVLGFAVHGLNGMMLIPLITIVLVITSLFMKFPKAKSKALIVLGLVALQVLLGLTAHGIVWLGPLHAINAFFVLWAALAAAWNSGGTLLRRTAAPVVA